MTRLSAAMTGHIETELTRHLLREDGQEDLCFAMWKPSTGRERSTALVGQPVLPTGGDRHVHGNASFEAKYTLRAAQEASKSGAGLVFMHSHPGGRGRQGLNEIDRVAETRIANIAREITGLPLLGLTVSGDRRWSARVWGGLGRHVAPASCESVRVIADTLSVTFDDALVPVPKISEAQVRTVHTWGDDVQALMARLRVAVAGLGSVGMAVADALARTGIERIGVFDFDSVEIVNLDRLRGADHLDAHLKRSKAHIARRLLSNGSTACQPHHEVHELSICEPDGFQRLLDFDLIVSCVDRPWPRHVLNTIAFADLIPVVEGGLRAFRNPDGSFRNAYWSSTVVRPGRPCLVCLKQYDPADVQVERDGSLDDPRYIEALPVGSALRSRENVAALTESVTAALLEQLVAYVARPSGFGDPGPLRFNLRDRVDVKRGRESCQEDCRYPSSSGCGDNRLDPTARHMAAEEARRSRANVPAGIHIARRADDLLDYLRSRLRDAM